MRRGLLFFSGVWLTAFVGCGNQQAEFANRADLSELIPEAQEHVRTVLQEHFGGPVTPVAWERMPVHFHGATGAVTEALAEDGSGAAKFQVAFSEENRPIEAGQEFAWISGENASGDNETTPHVVSFDEATGTVEISPAPASAPVAGDRFAIAPGVVLQHGRMLYAEHCQHCHGVSGDGDGPTARYLNPRPRDYRLGKFKFTSTQSPARASREDLATTIEEGIPGTYMPSFKLLTPEESQALVEYVRWLAMRGEVEFKLVQALKNDYSRDAVQSSIDSARADSSDLTARQAREQVIAELNEYLEGDWQDEFNDDTKFQAEQWQQADDPESLVLPTVARVPDTPESRENGRALYLSAKAKCATCHGEGGLGDGSQTLAIQKNPATNEDYPVPGLFDDWGNPLPPRNLTRGVYRGGRRPVDLYRRIYAGIKGTPMPAFGTVLKDEEIWDIVNYVTHLPFEAEQRRPGDGAHEVRPESPEVATADGKKELPIAN